MMYEISPELPSVIYGVGMKINQLAKQYRKSRSKDLRATVSHDIIALSILQVDLVSVYVGAVREMKPSPDMLESDGVGLGLDGYDEMLQACNTLYDGALKMLVRGNSEMGMPCQ